MNAITMDRPQSCLVQQPATARPIPAGSLAEQLEHFRERYRHWMARRATLRALETMPFGMRKDFGWPSPDR